MNKAHVQLRDVVLLFAIVMVALGRFQRESRYKFQTLSLQQRKFKTKCIDNLNNECHIKYGVKMECIRSSYRKGTYSSIPDE